MPRADHVFRNQGDTLRVRIYERGSGRWDYDAVRLGWKYNARISSTYSADGDDFATKKEAFDTAEDHYGNLHPIDVATVDEGWPAVIVRKPRPDDHVAIAVGQIWRQGSRRLQVVEVAAHWMQGRGGVPATAEQIEYYWIDPSGRETGRTIQGRRARGYALDVAFREKFRYVSDGTK